MQFNFVPILQNSVFLCKFKSFYISNSFISGSPGLNQFLVPVFPPIYDSKTCMHDEICLNINLCANVSNTF